MEISNFNLDFFYYQREIILDGDDPIHLKNLEHYFKFRKYCKQAPIEQVMEFMVYVYAKKYAIEDAWLFIFKKETDLLPEVSPDFIDDDLDGYLSNLNLENGYKSLIFKNFLDLELGTHFVEWIKIEFSNSQNREKLIQATIKGLNGTSFNQSIEQNAAVIIPDNSPIAKIEITETSFMMVFNKDKWVAYYG